MTPARDDDGTAEQGTEGNESGALEKCRAERPTSAGPAVAGSRSRWLLCDYTTSIRTLLTNYLNTFKGDIPHRTCPSFIPARARPRGYSKTAVIRGDRQPLQLKGAESDYFFSYGLGKHANMPTYESNTHTYIKRTCASWPMHQRPAVSHTKPHDNTDAGVCAEPHAPGSTPSRAPTPPRPHRPPKA